MTKVRHLDGANKTLLAEKAEVEMLFAFNLSYETRFYEKRFNKRSILSTDCSRLSIEVA